MVTCRHTDFALPLDELIRLLAAGAGAGIPRAPEGAVEGCCERTPHADTAAAGGTSGARGQQLGEQGPDAPFDLVADRPDGLDALTGGVVQ